MKNGLPVNAVRFFQSFNRYMENKDEYGLGIADEHTFDRFSEAGAEVTQKLYEEYKQYREQLREYYRKTGEKWERDTPYEQYRSDSIDL